MQFAVLRVFSLFCDFLRILPFDDAALEIDNAKLCLVQDFSTAHTAFARTAIDAYGAFTRESRLYFFEEVGLLHIYISGPWNVALSKLFGRTNVQKLYVARLQQFFKLIGIHALDTWNGYAARCEGEEQPCGCKENFHK